MGVNNNINPNIETTEGPLVKALNHYFFVESIPGMGHRNQVSNALNETTEPISQIQERFNLFFSYSSTVRVKKFLDLIEYLSVFSSEKLLDIINTEKFMETFASMLMEPDFQDNLLNLLRIWHDTYDKEISKAQRIFDLIENLPNFGLIIPGYYKSKYEGIDRSNLTLPEKEKDPKSKDEMSSRGSAKGDRYRTFEDEAGVLMNHADPKRALAFLDELNSVIAKKRTPSFDSAETSAVYGPKPKYESRDSMKGGDSPYMMNIEEFISYKRDPCPHEMTCKFAPIVKKGFQLGGLKREVNCIYWHNAQDRRRPFIDERGNLLYKYTMCNVKQDCKNQDKCKKSHNFFETFYHPLNYKKKWCHAHDSCKNGKHCPCFHSTKEKEAWGRMLKEYFGLREEAEEPVDEDIWEDDSKSSKHAYDNVRKHLPPSVMIPPPIEENHSYSKERHGYEKVYVEKQKEEVKQDIKDVPSQKPKDKELLSTLVLRKNYVDPNELTAILYKNPCFYGVPLYGNERQGGKDKQNGEQKNGKSLENGQFV